MTITINYQQKAAPGYTPRKPLTLHNVDAVVGKGVRMIEVRFIFTDNRPTHDHVASVSVQPEMDEKPLKLEGPFIGDANGRNS